MHQEDLITEIQAKQEIHKKAQELAEKQLEINKNTYKFNLECAALKMAALRDSIEAFKTLIELDVDNRPNSMLDEKLRIENFQKICVINQTLINDLFNTLVQRSESNGNE